MLNIYLNLHENDKSLLKWTWWSCMQGSQRNLENLEIRILFVQVQK